MLRNQKGFSMMEAIVAAGLVGVITVAALTLWETYFKVDLGQARITELSKDLFVLRSFIEDPKACEINFKGKTLGTKLLEFKNSNGATILKVKDKIGKDAYVLESIELGSFDPPTGRTSLNLTLVKTDIKGRSQSLIRKFFFLTKVKSNIIEDCIDPLKTTSDGALVKICADADPERTWDCEKVLANVALEIKRKYCGNHPILKFNASTGKCYAFDAAKNCSNGFIRGFDGNGNVVCFGGPGKPVPLPGSCSYWSDWSPDHRTICKGDTFEQKRYCTDVGFSATEKRNILGSKEGCEVAK